MTLDQEFLPEAFIMALFGLNPEKKSDIEHLGKLRRQGLPFVRLSQRVRVYPRAEVSAYLAKHLMAGVDE